VTRGGFRAALCQEEGAGATGRVAAPELPRVGTRELGPRDIWTRVSARLALCLDLELIRGGTQSVGYRQWPWAHLERGSEPAGGANIFFPCCFFEFCTLVF
jgi:hypothetical protein